MADYKAMYHKLFRAQTKAIRILQDAQRETEDMFIEAKDANIQVLPPPDKKDEE